MSTSYSIRQYTFLDKLLISLSHLSLDKENRPQAHRPYPAENLAEAPLNLEEQKTSAALMRVNHSGEVAAQGLYYGQALMESEPSVCEHLWQAAQEETDHLYWCRRRLKELNSRSSLLAPFWSLGSFIIGASVGARGRTLSLSFLAETEKQVSAHLVSHLDRLPAQDLKSRAIVQTMLADEQQHASDAIHRGGLALSFFWRRFMAATAQIMTRVSHVI